MSKFIFLITSTSKRLAKCYDVYESAVVVASSEEDAKNIHPDGSTNSGESNTWSPSHMVAVTKLGVVTMDVDENFSCGDVISASFIGG